MRRMDLQLFSDDKREAPTAKKRKQAREKGQVMKSSDATAAIMLLAAFGLIRMTMGSTYIRVTGLFSSIYEDYLLKDIGTVEVVDLAGQVVSTGLAVLAPLLVGVVVVGLVVTAAQVGLHISFTPLGPRLDRMDPVKGMGKVVSTRALVELIKGVVKLVVMGTVIYMTLRPTLTVPLHVDMPLEMSLVGIGQLLWTLAWRSGLTLLILGAGDLGYQFWEHEKGLRMTQREVREEHRDTEGDPMVRGRRRERARQMARERMLMDVRDSDVVVTNPTRYAVALRYDAETMAAPVVTARGRGFLAGRIRDLAREHGVTMVENRNLAPVLYGSTKVGDPVPAHLYQAVAEILAYVWQVEGRNAGRGRRNSRAR